MKRKSFISCCGAILIALMPASCGDDSEATPRKITAVRQLKAQTGYGEVVVKWLNPRSGELSHINVLYRDPEGNEQTEKVTEWRGDPTTGVSEGEFRLECSDSRRYFFAVTAYTLSGYESPTDTVSGVAPDITKADYLLSTVNMKTAVGGVQVTWVYEESIYADIVLKYISGGVWHTLNITAGESGEMLCSDLPESLTEYTVTTVNRSNNDESSYARKFNARWVNLDVNNVTAIPKTNPAWTVLSNPAGQFQDRAPERLFDNDVNTDWHSAAPPPMEMPHTVVIDTHRNFYIFRYELYPRTDEPNPQTQTSLRIWVSPDNVNWTDTGTHPFTPNYPAYVDASKAGQTLSWFKFDTEYIPARYIKLEMIEGGPYSMMGELSLFGIVID
jgi:hypothetical protein